MPIQFMPDPVLDSVPCIPSSRSIFSTDSVMFISLWSVAWMSIHMYHKKVWKLQTLVYSLVNWNNLFLLEIFIYHLMSFIRLITTVLQNTCGTSKSKAWEMDRHTDGWWKKWFLCGGFAWPVQQKYLVHISTKQKHTVQLVIAGHLVRQTPV